MASKSMREGSAYVIVACLSALSDWTVFTAISSLFPKVDVVFAQAPARLTGGVVAFVLHRLWSFKEQNGEGLGTEAGRFMALYMFSFCLSLSIVFVMVDLLGANRYWAKGVADIACFVVNFFVMKFYVFASTGAAKAARPAESTKSSLL